MTVIAKFPFQFGSKDWRHVGEEYWDIFQTDAIDYTVVDGQIVRTVESIREYIAGQGLVPVNIVTGPGYLYADGNFYDQPFFIWQLSHIVTKDYSAIDENSYEVTIDDYDVIRQKHTITHEKIDGKLPLAPTVNSALSNLIQRPIAGTLNDNCGWTENTLTINNQWAENEDEMNRVVRRANQRANAITRTTSGRANPMIRLGSTMRRIDLKRSVDCREIVVEKSIKHDTRTGESTMDLVTEFWTR